MNQTKTRRAGHTLTGDGMYLLRMDDEHFFTRWLNDMPLGTRYPSAATRFTYSDCDDLCQRIRAKGFTSAVVCDRFGTMIDGAALEVERKANEARVRKFWG